MILILGTCVLLDVIRELCFKIGVDRSAETPLAGQPHGIWPLSQTHLWMAGGAAVWACELYLYLLALAQVPLSVAFPVLSLTYAAAPIAAVILLKERMPIRRAFGVALVTTGVIAVGQAGLA